MHVCLFGGMLRHYVSTITYILLAIDVEHTTVHICSLRKIFKTCSFLQHSPAFPNNLILWHIFFYLHISWFPQLCLIYTPQKSISNLLKIQRLQPKLTFIVNISAHFYNLVVVHYFDDDLYHMKVFI